MNDAESDYQLPVLPADLETMVDQLQQAEAVVYQLRSALRALVDKSAGPLSPRVIRAVAH